MAKLRSDRRLEGINSVGLNVLIIICQESGVSVGRLHNINSNRLFFSIQNKYSIAETFSVGFRIDDCFITIKTMRKIRAQKEGDVITVSAIIHTIEPSEEYKLGNALKSQTVIDEKSFNS